MPKNFTELEKRKNEIEKNNNGISWYLSFKEPQNNLIDKT